MQLILKENKKLNILNNEIYLTFDDGPNNHLNTTKKVLDLLDQFNIKASFSLIGENIRKNEKLVEHMIAMGHIIVNHSYYHNYNCILSEKKLINEIHKFNKLIQKIIGDSKIHIKYFRPPAGILTGGMIKILKQLDMKIFPVTYFGFDSEIGSFGKNLITNSIINHINRNKNGVIVLHDGYNRLLFTIKSKFKYSKSNRVWIVYVLEKVIKYFQDLGYQFKVPAKNKKSDSIWLFK